MKRERSFFRAAGLAAAMLAGLAACGGAARDGAGAELRFGFMTEPATLDPLSPNNTADGRSILFNVFEGLVKPAPDGALVPALAEDWRVEEGGRVYVFTLRQGVLFHDGSPFTADDAVFSLQTAQEARFSGFSGIDSVEAEGGRELRITLKAANPEFLPYLTIGIAPRGNADREGNPVGTGPFRIASYTTQQNLALEKFDGYWNPELPKLDRVTIVFLSDNNALLLALQGGNIDGAVVTGSLLRQLPADGFDTVSGFSNMAQLLALNNDAAPLNDARVRRAINYAVDIQEIIDAAFFGYGEPSGSPLIPGLRRAYNETLRDPYPVNVERARALLAEAGYADGFPLEITVPASYTMHVDTAQVLVNQLARAGISASIKLVDWGTWLSEVYQGKQYQATVISLDGNNVSPQAFLYRYQSTQRSNFVNFRSADYDRVYESAVNEIDETRRLALYRDAQKIISDAAAGVYIQDIYSFWVFRKGMYGGAVTYPVAATDFSVIYRK